MLKRLSFTPVMQVYITTIPPGEAPEQIRACWVGLTLPLAVPRRVQANSVGVLSQPKTRFGWSLARFLGQIKRIDGYLVNAGQAIEILTAQAPEAAQWWRSHTPHLLDPKHHFVFAAGSCEEVDS